MKKIKPYLNILCLKKYIAPCPPVAASPEQFDRSGTYRILKAWEPHKWKWQLHIHSVETENNIGDGHYDCDNS